MEKRYNNFIRNVNKLYENNDGNRDIIESILIPELSEALLDLIKNDENFVLIGGLALSYYVKPRTTMDIDILFLKETIPDILFNFKKIRNHVFQHDKTHVEVETLDSNFLNIPENIVKEIFKNSIKDKKYNINIADPSGLVVSKLFRFSRQDQADIEELIKYDKIDISNYSLEQNEIDKFLSIKNDLL
jgi:hypothetical protein